VKLARFALAAILLLASSASAEVIFSRRIYRTVGTSYQQIWIWDPISGALTQLTRTARDHLGPLCEDGRIRFYSPIYPPSLWSFDRSTGKEHEIGPIQEVAESTPATPSCQHFAKLGELEACGNDETLTISNAGKQIGRFQIETDTCDGKCETPLRSLAWSDDGKWLLAGEEGLNDGSGQRQDDYYLVHIGTMKLSPVASAQTAFWLHGLDRILYQTPQHLAPLPGGRHQVWVQQLMSFDPETGKTTPITSGLSDNLSPAWCNR
jgi:hypothetical protein